MPMIKKGGWKKTHFKKFEYGKAPGTIGHHTFPKSGSHEPDYKVKIEHPIYKQKKTRRKRPLIHT